MKKGQLHSHLFLPCFLDCHLNNQRASSLERQKRGPQSKHGVREHPMSIAALLLAWGVYLKELLLNSMFSLCHLVWNFEVRDWTIFLTTYIFHITVNSYGSTSQHTVRHKRLSIGFPAIREEEISYVQHKLRKICSHCQSILCFRKPLTAGLQEMFAPLGALKMAFNQPKFNSDYSRAHLLSKINMSPILDPTYWPRWSVSFPSERKSGEAIPCCLW